MLPDLIASEAHDRRQQSYHGFADAPERCLRGATAEGIGCKGVQPVLYDVGIKRAEFNGAKVVYPLVNLVEGKLVVPADHVRRQRGGQPQHVLVDGRHPVERDSLVRGEIEEVAEAVLEKIV